MDGSYANSTGLGAVDTYIPPWVLQAIGLFAFVFFCVFWAVTGRLAPELLAAAGTLYGVGLASEARKALKGSPEEPPPVAPAEPDREEIK